MAPVSQATALAPQTYRDRALADGHAKIDVSGAGPRIPYLPSAHTEYFDDPAEEVRAE